MAENIKIEVVTPEKVVVDDEAQIVVAPGSLGEFGVLDGHTPFLTTLNVGVLRYTDSNNQDRYVFVSGGFAEAMPDRVTVLAESAERRSDIDLDRAQEAMKRAEERLAGERSDNVDYTRAKAALERAFKRIRLVSGKE